MTVKARFDGRVFVPEWPVNLPVGYTLEIALPSQPVSPPPFESAPLLELLKILDQFPENPDWPEDGAAQHDHYLYGTPKRP
jgi:hypothetical protein